MKYVNAINDLLKEQVSAKKNLVLFGQNISTGSCLGGFTRGLEPGEGGMVINTPNSENTLTGVGFGLMMGGVPSVFFMKQLDFLLLGIDHLANTYNFIRTKHPDTSFTIMPAVVDSGFQGPQSSLNNLADFCSISNTLGYSITNIRDAKEIISSQLTSPGFRIIGLSIRLFGQEILDPGEPLSRKDCDWFQYSDGEDVTVACFNFSLPQGMDLQARLAEAGLGCSLFSVNSATPSDWEGIAASAARTKNLVVLDDSKSANSPCWHLSSSVLSQSSGVRVKSVLRERSDEWYSPSSEVFEPDYQSIIDWLTEAR